MNFDIKDVKSWSTRNEVELGKIGFFADSIEQLYKEECVISKLSLITKIDAFSFGDENNNSYAFFLPLDAVKKDKPKEKKYRVFKSMRELTEIVYSKDWEYDNLSVGDSLWIRRKGDEHYHQNLLITSLGYDENDLISMNGKSMQQWLDEFEFLAHREWKPFGVEVKNNE